ncbi:Thioredoxin family protein [Histomonas meleagridis]|uniref:Thioredoxin family protein n=1 Tax=Histomonas meleagridis TaxID=135588 RepID=UPI00355A5DA7|nr:Thioredoxin family protein [Histomonas meleagridis]KAH0805673.1 Thioredoxin family protein [Histomonas meleagridis]
MILSFLITYKVIVTQENCQEFVQNSTFIPSFILFYADYCGFCKQVLPAWAELMDLYENDTSVAVGQIECESNPYYRAIYQAPSFPSFVTFLRGKPNRLRPKRDLETFINLTEELKKVDLNIPCFKYPIEFTSEYPAFAFSSQRNYRDQCLFVRDIQERIPFLKNRIYFGESTAKPTLIAYLNKNVSVEYTGDFNPQAISKFVDEYSLSSLGNWNLSAAEKSTRKFMFIIHNYPQIYEKFRNEIELIENTTLFGQIEFKVFNETYPQYNVVPPAIAIASEDKSSFHIEHNTTQIPQLKEIFEKFENGEYKENTNIKIPKFFNYKGTTNERKKRWWEL